MTGPTGLDEEFQALRRLSARVGADPALVQAAGGNTSIKADGTLWIKASGLWLMHALDRDLFVPVSIEPLLRAVEEERPEAEKAQDFVIGHLNPSGLRPSIETTVHALMPQRVVIHVHCVETIARAIETGAEAAIAPLLAGFDWVFVPYRRPGLPLARGIAERIRPGTDVLVLGNHGLAVAADSVAEADRLLGRVSRALARPVRPAPAADVARLSALAGDRYRPASDPAAHAVATDPVSLAIARGGSYYPDHVIFLGHGAPVAGAGETADDVVARLAAAGQGAPPWILVPGAGVLIRADAGEAAGAMARCLADVAARVADGTPLETLTDTDVGALLNWDAEQYRQSLERRRREAAS
jgi:rhamnose utilization protein RhaD (predicted bifunctional aldolase and dehydrogenase)